jgi:hypothetical protein
MDLESIDEKDNLELTSVDCQTFANIADKLVQEKVNEFKTRNLKVPSIKQDKNGSLEIFVPKGFVDEKEITWLIIAKLVSRLKNVTVRQTGSPFTHNSIDYNGEIGKYFIGMLFQASEDTKQNLGGVNKVSAIGQGRRSGFALKVRGWFEDNRKRGFLRRHNTWFNNDPNISRNDTENAYLIRQMCMSLSNENFDGLALCKIYETLFMRLGLYEYKEQEVIKILGENLVTFEDYTKKYKIKVVSTKGRGRTRNKSTRVGFKNPKIPNPSPVLSSAENVLFQDIFSVVFPKLESVKKNWTNYFINGTLETIIPGLSEIYKVRNQIRQKFGSATTKRLQYLRKHVDPKIGRKVDVTGEQLTSYFSKVGSGYMDELALLLNSVFTADQLQVYCKSINSVARSAKELVTALDLQVNNLQKSTDIYSLIENQGGSEEEKKYNQLESVISTWNDNFKLLMHDLRMMQCCNKQQPYPGLKKNLDKHYNKMKSVYKQILRTSQRTWSNYYKKNSRKTIFLTDSSIANERWITEIHLRIEQDLTQNNVQTLGAIALYRLKFVRDTIAKDLIYALS